MTLVEMHVKWSVTLTDQLGPNSVNSFHPALKYTWENFENSLAFLDIKLSINDNSLSTSIHYKPTDAHNYCTRQGWMVGEGKEKEKGDYRRKREKPGH